MANVAHALASGADLHEGKRLKEPVRVASTANVTVSGPGSTIDGVTMVNGDRVLLKNQTTGGENGIYTWTGAATAMTRTTDADAAADLHYGFLVYVREGTVNAGTYWAYTTSTAVTLGTTTLTFVQASSAGFGTPGASAFGDTVSAGSATTAARSDHRHSREAGIAVQSGGSAVGTRPTINIVSGATVADNSGANRVDVTISGGGGGASSGGAGSGALVPIQTIGPLTATQASFPFTNIPQTGFRNLRLVLVGRGTATAQYVSARVQFSGDSGSNYDSNELNTATTANVGNSFAGTTGTFGYLSAASAASGGAGSIYVDIPNYAGTSFQKNWTAHSYHRSDASAGNQFQSVFGGTWRSTSAITSLVLTLSSGNFDVGTYACLYGEMDTAGALLTPASNLIGELDLTTATEFANIPQNYRDLRIEIVARSSQASAQEQVLLQYNGDTTAANYISEAVASQTTVTASAAVTTAPGASVAYVGGTSSTASRPGSVTVSIPNYTGTTFYKGAHSFGGAQLSAWYLAVWSSIWLNTAAITSIKLALTNGSFTAGSVARLYGEPAAAAGGAVGTGTRLRLSGNQSVSDDTDTLVNWDTEDSDADNQHYTSAANLTGTVSKTAASTTLTGSGTAFDTELSVGQLISVPGTAAEKRVVIAIASATSLTVNSAFANSASGQTAARVNSAVVFRQSGWYELKAGAYWASDADGYRTLAFVLNDTTVIGQDSRTSIGALAMGTTADAAQQFQQWDFVEVRVRHTAGAALNLTADQRTFFAVNARPTVIVAVPYAQLQDRKTDGSGGGGFSSGSWVTRTLNTIVSDDAGIIQLASNQITLRPGVYRIDANVPAYNVNDHAARLFNVTSSVTAVHGQNARSHSTANAADRAAIRGRFRVTQTSAFEIQHRCETTNGTDGLGRFTNFATDHEIYTDVEIWKEG